MQVLAKLDNALLAVLRAGVACAMAVTSVSVILQVFFRYVLSAPLTWSEELARYSMIWGAFLGGPIAIRRGLNVGITFITDRLPVRFQRVVLVLNAAVVIVFLGGLARYGLEFASFFSFQRSPVLEIPMNRMYIAIPISATLGVLQTVIATASHLRSGTGMEQTTSEV